MSKLDDRIMSNFNNVQDDTTFTIGAKMFSDIYNLITALEPIEPQLRVKPDGVYYRQLNDARVAQTELFLPRVLFRDYKVGEQVNILRFDRRDMEACLTGIAEGDLLTLSINERGGLQVKLKGKRERIYNIPLFEPDEVMEKSPRCVLPVKVKTDIDGIITEVKKAEKLLTSSSGKKEIWSSQVQITSNPTGLLLSFLSSDGARSAKIPLSKGWDILHIIETEKVKVISGSWYIAHILEAVSKVTNVVLIEIGSDLPVHIIPQLPFKAELSFWIAPRIEQEPGGGS